VLVADDHGPLRSMIADALRADGFAVDEVDNGGTALHRLLGEGYRAAVIDVRMPVLDGLQVLERLHMGGAACEVILMSVVADPVSRRRAAQFGAMAFHQKPFPLEALLEDVRRACDTPAVAGSALS
jgi:two-component system response regulator AtoC